MPQWDLLDLLADAGKDEPTFTLRMQTEITGLLRDGDTITGVQYQGLDGSGELRADLRVGCDGHTSTVRRAAGLVFVKILECSSGPAPSLAPGRTPVDRDAAHAMSPAGGVGINLAIADAVATARILAEPLRTHGVTARDLAAVRGRRNLPAAVTQAVQQVLLRFLIAFVLRGEIKQPPRTVTNAVARLFGWIPSLSVIPAFIVGVGLRPEHAPQFARWTASS